MVGIIEYRIKDVGQTAEDFRKLAETVLKTTVITEVHPGLVRFHVLGKYSKDALKALDEKMKELADAVRVSREVSRK